VRNTTDKPIKIHYTNKTQHLLTKHPETVLPGELKKLVFTQSEDSN